MSGFRMVVGLRELRSNGAIRGIQVDILELLALNIVGEQAVWGHHVDLQE